MIVDTRSVYIEFNVKAYLNMIAYPKDQLGVYSSVGKRLTQPFLIQRPQPSAPPRQPPRREYYRAQPEPERAVPPPPRQEQQRVSPLPVEVQEALQIFNEALGREVFDIMEIPNRRDIIRAYRELMMTYHPNKATQDATERERKSREETTQKKNKTKYILDKKL